MRKLSIALSTLLTVFVLSGCGGDQESAGADAGETSATAWTGGAALSVESPTTLAELVSQPATFVGQTLRLEGKVSGVCQGSGCWVELTDPEGHSFIAKSVDHSISFPKDCAGRQAVIQGVIVTQPVPGEAEAHAESAAGGEAHECPAPVYMMELKGAELI